MTSVQPAVLAVVPEQVGGVGTRPFLAVGPVGLLGTTADVEGDLAVAASPSAARALAAVNTGVPVVSIGPETSAAAREAGLRVAAEAATPDLDGLVRAVAEAE